MNIHVDDEAKIVEVWLTNQEKTNPKVQASLKPLYAKYKGTPYKVAVFLSGNRDLHSSVLDLLKYNRTRSAQREVQQEKRMRAAGMEQ